MPPSAFVIRDIEAKKASAAGVGAKKASAASIDAIVADELGFSLIAESHRVTPITQAMGVPYRSKSLPRGKCL
jgi:hypothetical protein